MKLRKRAQKLIRPIVGKRLAKRMDLPLIAVGALAYFGFKHLNKRGVFPKEAGAALNVGDAMTEKSSEILNPLTQPTETRIEH